MKIEVRRVGFSSKSTISEVWVDGTRLWYGLEDAVRQEKGVPVWKWKVRGRTAIPEGRYKVIVTQSTRFKRRLPLVVKVPGFTGIRIHSGNTHEHTEGCLLLGMKTSKGTVLQSRAACAEAQELIETALLAGDKVWITFTGVPGR
jgi:hypothetical protein